ncbi:MAG: flagellar hook-basal body complex protein FliE [Lachnospiraceae bacterium]|nr:flagellar hook-basal body complex protein FliE [Lachnospiraceae bacterium]MCI9150253.1 flagellar hook-basal body complex protein FliE [Lachnospiraceae bacterium]
MDNIAALTGATSTYIKDALAESAQGEIRDSGFDSVLQSAINMLNETNDLQNRAEQAEIEFTLGLSTNTHDLQIAQEKANIALQYTVAVRDKLLEAYNQIMNIQI